MSKFARGAIGCGLLAAGYVLGATGVLAPAPAAGQIQKAEGELSDEAAIKVKDAIKAVGEAVGALQADQKYTAATVNSNAFAALSGGVNAVEDLENGRGVDPETYAALYAGLATDEVKFKLTQDEEGRILYDGKVVRLYSRARLKFLFAERDRLAILKQRPGQ